MERVGEHAVPAGPLAVRDVLYAGDVPGLDVLAYCLLAGALAVLLGRALFRRLEPELAVVV